MRYDEIELKAGDATRLFVRRYTPSAADASRTLLIVHGALEHGGRYEHISRLFVERGWNVVAADLRGHGRSGGPRIHVTRFRQYVDDLERVCKHFHLRPKQTAALGHSMGGLVSIRFAQKLQERVAALALTSPLLGIKVAIPQTTLLLGKLLSYLVPRWRFRSRIDPAETTHDSVVLKRRAEDPLIGRSVTAGWFFEINRAMQTAWDESDRLRLPLLVVQAGQDRIVDPVVVEPWLKTVGSVDTHFCRLPEHRHEVLNETDWETTTEDIAEWLNERINGI